MSTDSDHEADYENIIVNHPVSVKPVKKIRGDVMLSKAVFILLGPVGAGKSRFIESLAMGASLNISSGGLEGCTQYISAYSLSNVHGDFNDARIYLVDVPGFADTKISHLKIIWMLEKYIRGLGAQSSHILYLMPINNPRLSGSMRGVLDILKHIVGLEGAGRVTIVTTMWDCMMEETAATQGEDRFKYLRDNVWKDFIDNGSQIMKFYNDKKSALGVLDAAMRTPNPNNAFKFEDWLFSATDQTDRLAVRESLCLELISRISQLRQQRDGITADLTHMGNVEEEEDQTLRMILLDRLKEIKETEEQFQEELGVLDKEISRGGLRTLWEDYKYLPTIVRFGCTIRYEMLRMNIKFRLRPWALGLKLKLEALYTS